MKFTRQRDIIKTHPEYRHNLITEFDIDSWIGNSWGFKRCFRDSNPPKWFDLLAPYNHIVMYDWDEEIFIDGEEKNEDLFQLSWFRNQSLPVKYLFSILSK